MMTDDMIGDRQLNIVYIGNSEAVRQFFHPFCVTVQKNTAYIRARGGESKLQIGGVGHKKLKTFFRSMLFCLKCYTVCDLLT